MADIGALAETLLDQATPCTFELVLGQFTGPDRLGRNIPFRVHFSPGEGVPVARSNPSAYGRQPRLVTKQASRDRRSDQAAIPV